LQGRLERKEQKKIVLTNEKRKRMARRQFACGAAEKKKSRVREGGFKRDGTERFQRTITDVGR